LILTLQSTTFGAHGGIPTYNRVVCRVLNELTDPIEKQLFVVTDTTDDLELHRSELPHLTLTPFSGRRSAFVGQVTRLAVTRKIDLLLIGHVNYAPLGLLLKRFQPSLRYGVMVHGVDVWSRLPWLKRQALQKADFITSVSEYTKQQVVTLNDVDPGRVCWLPNALEWKESEDEEVALPGIVPSAIRLLTVCRFSTHERYKGVDTVIEALPSVIDSVPNIHYFVIGGGADLERHKNLARRLGVAERVHFLGSVDTPTLRAHYKACDIFVMPSAGEGFGIVFLEAMRYAKPIIAAESGAIPEVIQEGKTGKLVAYGNKEQLGEALTNLCLNPDERHRLGTAGYQRLQDNFTYQHFKEKLSAILLRELASEASMKERARSAEAGRASL
jgi:phosphatidyl-myo-inositol dimannoside synthase